MKVFTTIGSPFEINAIRRPQRIQGPGWGLFYEPRVTRGDVVNLSLSPRMSLGMYTGFTRDALWASPTEAACDRRGRQVPNSMNDLR